MVKPGFSDHQSWVDSAAAHQARRAVDDLAKGRAVAPEDVEQARGTLLDLLRSAQSDQRATAREGLEVIYSQASDDERCAMIGEFAAAGSGGESFLESVRKNPPLHFELEEIEALMANSKMSPREKLMMVSEWIGIAKEQSGGGLPSGSEWVAAAHVLAAADRKLRAMLGRSDPTADPPDEKDPLTQAAWLKTAQNLDADAVDVLFDHLEDGNLDEEEVAVMVLMHFGENPKAAALVHERARRLESEKPDLRAVGEHIRKHVESGGSGENDSRRKAVEARLPDDLLKAAIELGDAPSILRASAGREALALPLLTRKLYEVRSRRAKP